MDALDYYGSHGQPQRDREAILIVHNAVIRSQLQKELPQQDSLEILTHAEAKKRLETSQGWPVAWHGRWLLCDEGHLFFETIFRYMPQTTPAAQQQKKQL